MALLIAGLAAVGAGAGLWGGNALKDDAKEDATELSTDGETGSTTTFEGTGATAGQSGASEKSPEQIAFEQKYPTLWGRTEAILEAAGKNKTVSAMDFLDSRIANLPEGYSVVKIDQPGMGDGEASKNTYYLMKKPNGTVTTDPNEIGAAMGLSTIEDIKAALADI